MKKILAAVLSLLLVASLWGCSQKEDVKFYESKTYRNVRLGCITDKDNP